LGFISGSLAGYALVGEENDSITALALKPFRAHESLQRTSVHSPPAPEPPSFPMDPIKEEVGELLRKVFFHHPGRLDLGALPATRKDAEKLWFRVTADSWLSHKSVHPIDGEINDS
jgi:hypothetical protein